VKGGVTFKSPVRPLFRVFAPLSLPHIGR